MLAAIALIALALTLPAFGREGTVEPTFMTLGIIN